MIFSAECRLQNQVIDGEGLDVEGAVQNQNVQGASS